MIETLTSEQTAKMSEYAEKYIKIGFDTDNSATQEEITQIVNDLYVNLLNKPVPEQVVVRESPNSAWAYICEQNTNLTMKDFVWPFFTGSFDSNIFAFYDFFQNELDIKFSETDTKNYQIWKKILNVGLIYPFDDICVVCRKPTKVSLKGTKLHCDDGPAIEYSDGWAIYMLNGVKMTKEYVVTPWDKIESKTILKEKNVEVRRELIRKVGMERFIEGAGAKVVDSEGDYELLMVDIGLGKKEMKPYLKMKNPSIGVFHVEGVSPECKTVKDALFFRNKTHETPSKLS